MNKLAVLAILGLSFNSLASTQSTYFAPLDVKALHDQEVRVEKKGEAPSFAVPHQVSINAVTSQNWEKSTNGLVWSHQVTAPNAVSLNFGFSKFNLPEGAELNIFSADRTEFIRTFTSADNNAARELWTPIIMSDDVIIELTVPAGLENEVELEIGQVGQGFRTFGQSTEKSGSCNVDVACSDSQGWENEVNSVAVISTGGSRFCTGFMVNNTKNDKTPFFMTANHCRINSSTAPSLVTYWNYQTSKCGGSRDGKLTDFTTGATFLAASAKSDFALVKLNKSPDAAYNVKYSGWDASPGISKAAVAIHHPNVDEKAISFENDPTQINSYGGTGAAPGDGTHVRVIDWDKGTTEPGSSGSPLFDGETHRVVGQLHGGGAACGNDLSDYYGRFHTSWAGDGSASTGLKTHLDAAKSGALFTDTI